MLGALRSLVSTPLATGLAGALTALPLVAVLPSGGGTLHALPPADGSGAEVTYHQLSAIPMTSPTDELERAAVELAHTLQAVPVSADGELCPRDRLTVSWQGPPADAVHGAFIEPLGPPPGADTVEVNGVVVCRDAPYAFMGFEATRGDGRWDLSAVPYLEDEGEGHGAEEHPGDHDDHGHGGAGTATPDEEARDRAGEILDDLSRLDLGPIDPYATYEPQRICRPTAKPGTAALRSLLLGRYTSTRSLGISRACHIGGRSEHKEGRAFDWGAHVSDPVERREVEDLLGRLLATDAAGNHHALARRAGVMYVIWNRRIWSAYRPAAGWRPYHGASPHTDHVHVSLSWDGAMGRTTLWRALAADGSLAELVLGPDASPAPREPAPVTPTTDPRDEPPKARRDADEPSPGPTTEPSTSGGGTVQEPKPTKPSKDTGGDATTDDPAPGSGEGGSAGGPPSKDREPGDGGPGKGSGKGNAEKKGGGKKGGQDADGDELGGQASQDGPDPAGGKGPRGGPGSEKGGGPGVGKGGEKGEGGGKG